MKNSPSFQRDRNFSKGSLPKISQIIQPNYVKGDRNHKKKINGDLLMI